MAFNLDINSSLNITATTFLDVVPGEEIDDTFRVVILCILAIVCFTSLLGNALLLITISVSYSLRTPPNAHLTNICINSLVVCCCTALALASMTTSSQTVADSLNYSRVYFCTNSVMQYWFSFAIITMYRYKIIKQPSMTTSHRTVLVRRSIVISWLCSLMLSLSVVLCNNGSALFLVWCSFDTRVECFRTTSGSHDSCSAVIGYFVGVMFALGLVTMMVSFRKVCQTLHSSAKRSRVKPLNLVSSVSARVDSVANIQHEHSDLMVMKDDLTRRRLYIIRNGGWVTPEPGTQNNQTTYYNQSQTMPTTRSRQTSSALATSHRPSNEIFSRFTEFTDISPSSILFQHGDIKVRFAAKRHQETLYSATKNTLIMLAIFLLSITPIFIASFPGTRSPLNPGQEKTLLIVCQMVYFLNGPTYSLWYLFFSKKVRSCLAKLKENVNDVINNHL